MLSLQTPGEPSVSSACCLGASFSRKALLHEAKIKSALYSSTICSSDGYPDVLITGIAAYASA